MNRSVWKGPFCSASLVKHILRANKAKEDSGSQAKINTYSRASTILSMFVGLVINVHNGKNFVPVFVTDSMIGHKLGEFVFTRKMPTRKKAVAADRRIKKK